MAELIKAMSRTEKGSTACNRVRRAGLIPAVLNGEHCGSLKLKLDAHDFEQLIKHHTGTNIVCNIAVDGSDEIVALLDELQVHTVNGKIIHADFKEVSVTKKLHTQIEVILTGDPVGTTMDQGVLEQTMHELEVECLYTALVESISVDVTDLKVGDKVSVEDVVAPNGITILSDPDLTIASVNIPSVKTEVEEEDGEPELIDGEEVAEKAAEENE
ncbi:MAG: 50S ribosomal protein L25 [Kiritimatiellae bacterium]|jgi:large subunit ribosomal protein L25|nr:50S ribosomal protein L25 [Kiritimatiellia bacterium]